MKISEKMNELQKKGEAIWATNFYNLETLRGILLGAISANQAVILQLSPGSIAYIGLDTAVAMVRAMVKEAGLEAWLHLDHASDENLIRKCLDAGFDSVMIDASELPFAENVKVTRDIVRIASNYGAFVEAELGYVAKLGQEQASSGFTDPEEARKFVMETGVDALAVAIGSAHGFYKEEPKLDIRLLEEIHRIIPDTALVLHGSSGIKDEVIKKAVKAGIRKINLATEIKDVFMAKLRELLINSGEIDLRKIFPEAIEAVSTLIRKKMFITKRNM